MVLVKHHIKLVKTFLNFKLIILLKVYPCLWRETFPLFLRNRRLIQMKLSLGWILWISWFDETCRFCNKRTLPPVRLSVYEERPASEGLHTTRPRARGSQEMGIIYPEKLRRKREDESERRWRMYAQDYLLIFVIYTRENFTAFTNFRIPLKWRCVAT